MDNSHDSNEPLAYGMWDTMLGKGNRMMMVRLDKGQDGCTVPLYTTPPQPEQSQVEETLRYEIDALETKLAECRAQSQQEPVAWKDEQGNVRMTLDAGEIQSSVGYVYSVHGERIKNACIRSDIPNGTPLYTSPPAAPASQEEIQRLSALVCAQQITIEKLESQRQWVGLTDEELQKILQEVSGQGWKPMLEGIEAKLKEKNT